MRLEQRANMGAMKEVRNTLNRRSSSPSGLHFSRICTLCVPSLAAIEAILYQKQQKWQL